LPCGQVETGEKGAGPKSFRPKLEGLEDRQLMASLLAGTLPVKPPAPSPEAVSLRRFTTGGVMVGDRRTGPRAGAGSS